MSLCCQRDVKCVRARAFAGAILRWGEAARSEPQASDERRKGGEAPLRVYSYRAVLDAVAARGAGGGVEAEPIEAVRAEAQEVRPVADGREARVAEQLER